MIKLSRINHEERAYRAWNILIDRAQKKQTITYKELGDAINVHHRACRFFLDHIQNYCLDNKLAPLTILVVNQEGVVGEGFIAWDTSNIKEGQKQVFKYNWANLLNPFTYASDGSTELDLVNNIIAIPNTRSDLYSRIKVRGIAQQIFRKALLRAYGSRCAFCGFSIEVALEAAHIIPWSMSSSEEKLSVNNGILLCSNHHKLFDNDILMIIDNYIIESNLSYTSKIIGKRIRLPQRKEHYPSKDNIKRRYSIYSN